MKQLSNARRMTRNQKAATEPRKRSHSYVGAAANQATE